MVASRIMPVILKDSKMANRFGFISYRGTENVVDGILKFANESNILGQKAALLAADLAGAFNRVQFKMLVVETYMHIAYYRGIT